MALFSEAVTIRKLDITYIVYHILYYYHRDLSVYSLFIQNGVTALMEAHRNRENDIKSLLLRKGAVLNVIDKVCFII